MSFRDDRDALLARMDALERELAQTSEERDAAREELQRVRAEHAAAANKERLTARQLALVPVERPRRPGRDASLGAATALLAGWTVVTVVLGPAAWMLPAMIVSVMVASHFAHRKGQ